MDEYKKKEKGSGYVNNRKKKTPVTLIKNKKKEKDTHRKPKKEGKSTSSTYAKVEEEDKENENPEKEPNQFKPATRSTLRSKSKALQCLKYVDGGKESSKSVANKGSDEPPEKKSKPNTEAKRKAKAKRKMKSKRISMVTVAALALKPALQRYEMIWAHVKGFRNWPGIIENETTKGKYKIHFFGDYSTSDVSKNKIMHLMEGFKDYTNADKPTHLLRKAIEDA